MQSLFLRSAKTTPLTWTEVDTNWTRIKNAVDWLENHLEETRTQPQTWLLPLTLEEGPAGTLQQLNKVTAFRPEWGLHYKTPTFHQAVTPIGLFGSFGNQKEQIWIDAVNHGSSRNP